EFDLGLHEPYFPLEEELTFQALSLALTTFTKEVWPEFQNVTEGAVLYRGSSDFHTFFLWTEKQELNWEEWKLGKALNEEHHWKRLFCAEMFVTSFQMLAHRLPDEMPLFLALAPPQSGTPAEK